MLEVVTQEARVEPAGQMEGSGAPCRCSFAGWQEGGTLTSVH